MVQCTEVVRIAMRRVSRGGVGTVSGHWLDDGRPVPCFLPEALDSLTNASLVMLTAPDSGGQRRATLTDSGAVRYAELSESNEGGSGL